MRIQQSLAEEVFSGRIGLHSGEALERGSDYTGRGVNVAARIGALAGAGEILVSTETLDGTSSPYALSEPRTAELKGFEEPVPIAAVEYRTQSSVRLVRFTSDPRCTRSWIRNGVISRQIRV